MTLLWRFALASSVFVLAACTAGPESDPVKVENSAEAATLEVPCSEHTDARLKEMSDEGIGLTSELGLPAGRYALPADAAPTQLVVMFHGHSNDSCSWRNHLADAASRGAVAVAMDYTGLVQEPKENYGWPARAGAADSIAAARYFLDQYPTITNVIAFAVSMGGSVSGVAMASDDAVRADGSPLFDYWIDIEGVNDITQEYLIVRGIADVNADAKQAKDEIEAENGGAIEEVPEAYAEITNVLRAGDMELKGVALVNGFDDGLVPTNQTDEMATALRVAGIPAHTYKIVLKGDDESGTTATSIPLGPVASGAGQEYESPFAGHGWEGSSTHLVMKKGLEVLHSLMEGGIIEPGISEDPGL